MPERPFSGRDPWPNVPDARRRIMSGNRRRDTSPEVAVRSLVHRRGLRFRVDLPIHIEGRRPIRPDLVFTRARVAVFIDGCFWHGCPEHGTPSRSRREYWEPKIAGNRARDHEADRLLREAGWTVVRAWEHDATETIASRVEMAVAGSAVGRSRVGRS